MNRTTIAALMLVTAAGCGGQLDTSENTTYEEESVVASGLDYSWGRPTLSTVHHDGYKFVARYLSFDTTGKNLSKHEADELHAAGIDIVVVWENNPDDALKGHAEGVKHAQAAEAQAKACGMPAGRPIYFAVDFDAQPSQQSEIDAYFDGAASVLGRSRVGAYGGHGLIQRLFNGHKIAYGWQTYAWSYGAWDTRAQVRQVDNGIYVGGAQVDLDHAVAHDFGQWGWKPPSPVAPKGRQLVVGHNSDGRLELFYARTGDSAIEHMWQRTADGTTGWSANTGLAGAAESLTVGPNADGRLQIFWIGTNSELYTNFQERGGGWYGQLKMGGSAKQLAVGRNSDGRLELFYIGTNDELYHNYQLSPNGEWSGQHTLGGKALQVAVGADSDGKLEVVYVGTDERLYHVYQTSHGWHAPEPLGASAKRVAVARNNDGKLEIFYIAPNDRLYHDEQVAANGAFAGPREVAGEAKEIAVGKNHDGRLELFFIGTNSDLYHDYQNSADGSWSGQHALGGAAKEISIARNSDGRLELFYVGTDSELYHNWQKTAGGAWDGQHKM